MLLEVTAIVSAFLAGKRMLSKSETAKSAKSSKPVSNNGLVKQEVKAVTSQSALAKVSRQLTERITSSLQLKGPNWQFDITMLSMGLAILGALLVNPLLSILSLPAPLYLTWPIHKSTWEALKQGKVKVDTMATITAIGGIIYGYYVIINLISVFYQLSSKLMAMVRDDSQKNLIDVFKSHPDYVWVLVDGVEIETPFAALNQGDIVVVHAGESIPADGTIIEGIASVDQHILTGEAQPAEKIVGHQVFASTVVLTGSIQIEVERSGADTTVAQIGDILNSTVDFKSTAQLRSETLADQTVLPTIVFGALTFPFLGGNSALAIINSHFKYKLRTVAPISILNHLNIATHNGILIKDGRTLDLLNEVDTIVFDKTGTLTQEEPHVGQILTYSTYTEEEVLALAAAAEYKQSHPIARAILKTAQERELEISDIDDTQYQVGYGLTVVMDDRLILVGSYRFMEMSNIEIPQIMADALIQTHELGHSLVMVAVDDELAGALELIPTVRPEALEVINTLRQRPNIKEFYIISGDHETPTRMLAKSLGIDSYFAQTLPENKADLVEQLQNEGKYICYMGDGINDSIALKKSQVSVSLRGASTVATDTAQVIMMDGSLKQLNQLFDIAHDFKSNMNTTFGTVLAPMFLGMAGVLFFHFGLVHTIIINQVSLLAGVGCVAMPWFNYRRQHPELAQPVQAELEASTPMSSVDSVSKEEVLVSS